jgi:hypothetical protein
MTSTNLKLNEMLPNTASRETGVALRSLIVAQLETVPQLEIDFTDLTLTPSFADEAFGLLCHHLSIDELFERIKFLNLTAVQKLLLKRVISNRFSAK